MLHFGQDKKVIQLVALSQLIYIVLTRACTCLYICELCGPQTTSCFLSLARSKNFTALVEVPKRVKLTSESKIMSHVT